MLLRCKFNVVNRIIHQSVVRGINRRPKANVVNDRFHLIKYLNEAIDKVRGREVKQHEAMKKSQFLLLKNK